MVCLIILVSNCFNMSPRGLLLLVGDRAVEVGQTTSTLGFGLVAVASWSVDTALKGHFCIRKCWVPEMRNPSLLAILDCAEALNPKLQPSVCCMV